MNDTLFIDFETNSLCDLKKCGGYHYAMHPSTKPILLAYAFGREAPKVVPFPRDGMGADGLAIVEHIRAGGKVVAWNAEFDVAIWNEKMDTYKIKPEQVIDAMAMSRAMGLPGALGDAASCTNNTSSKNTAAGKAGFRLFCGGPDGLRRAINAEQVLEYLKYKSSKWEPDVDVWINFKKYAGVDVQVMQDLYYDKLNPLTPVEILNMQMDMRTNMRGIPLDMVALSYAENRAQVLADGATFVCKAITGGIAPTQLKQLLGWVNSRITPKVQDLQAGTIAELLASERLPSDVRTVLESRQTVSKTSVAKLAAMRAANVDGIVRGTLGYHVATTGRAGGRLIQPQNFPRPHIKQDEIEKLVANNFENATMQELSSCLRAIIADLDNGLVAADLSNIEGRVLAWLAGETWKIKAFADFDAGVGPDLYLVTAGRIYGVNPSTLDPEGIERQGGKTAELACGYQGGVGAFATMAKTLGVKVADPESIVKAWRSAHPETVKLWRNMERKAIMCVQYRRSFDVGPISFHMDGNHLMMRLPSGRELCYPNASIIEKEMPWGKTKKVVAFFGRDTYTQRWGKCLTYGGKLVENGVQAIARDILYAAMRDIEADGHEIYMHVHDEVVCKGGKLTPKMLCDYLTQPRVWAPGLPLAAKGWEGKRFRK